MRRFDPRSRPFLSPWPMALAALTLVELLAWAWTAHDSVTVAPPFL